MTTIHEEQYRDKALEALAELADSEGSGTPEERLQAADMLLKATEPDFFSQLPVSSTSWYEVSVLNLFKFFLKATIAVMPSILLMCTLFILSGLLATFWANIFM